MKNLSKRIIEYDDITTFYKNNKDIIWKKCGKIYLKSSSRFYIETERFFGHLLYVNDFNKIMYIAKYCESEYCYVDIVESFNIYGIKYYDYAVIKKENYNIIKVII